MKKQILGRYSRTPDNKLMIDVVAGKVIDLFNDFDKHAPYIKKDLDPDLVEYMILEQDWIPELDRWRYLSDLSIITKNISWLGLRMSLFLYHHIVVDS